MKIKAEKVMLLMFGQDRTVRFERGLKLKEDIIIKGELGRAYIRRNNGKNSLMLFLQSCVEPAKGNTVKIEDLYGEYIKFCEEYNFEILPSSKFVDIIDDYLEVDAINGVVKDIRITDKRVKVEKEADIYIYERQGLFRKKRIPVFIVVEGIPKTITFDELRSYAKGDNNELISLDDFTLGQMLSESMFIGATIGTQKLFSDMKFMIIVTLAMALIAVVLCSYNLYYVQQILQILQKLL